MKTPLLGLVVATAAFAGSSLYLWVQLNEERGRAAQVEAAAGKLNARIAELEKARNDFEQRRLDGDPVTAGTFGPPGVKSVPAAALPAGENAEAAQPRAVWNHVRPDRSPAFQKMMRSQVKAGTRRQYADVGEKLGLSKERAAKLIDLLADQQVAMMTDASAINESGQAPFDYEQRQRENETAISDLIGADKAMQLKEYQESLPARQEFEMLARQLEDYGSPLSESQRKSLVDVVIEERKREPMPAYVDGMDQVEYAKAVNAWKDTYEKRIADEANRILNIEQMTAYNEIQQLQKDMREQFAVSGIAIAGPAGPGGSMRRMGYVNSVAVTTAAPVNAAGAAVNTIVVTKEEQKKP